MSSGSQESAAQEGKVAASSNDADPTSGATDPGFAPADPLDGRSLFQWQSKWPKEARRPIRAEAAYVVGVFSLALGLIYWTWAGTLSKPLSLDRQQYEVFSRYSYAFSGGLLGGTLFDLKWLYHTVARGSWHLDRRYWRLFTPWLSAGLAFALILLANSGLVPLLDQREIRRSPATLGVAFLVGYFSDNTIAAMARLSDRLFGEK